MEIPNHHNSWNPKLADRHGVGSQKFSSASYQDLNPGDFANVSPNNSTEFLGYQLFKYWNSQLQKEKPMLGKAIFQCFGVRYFKIVLLLLIRDVIFRFGQCLCIMLVLQYLDGSATYESCMLGVVLMIIFVSLNTTLTPFYMMKCLELGMQLRVSLTSLVFNKILSLPHGASDIGQLMNLVSNDVNRFDRFIHHTTYMFTTPIQFLVLVEVAWSFMGTSIIPGTCVCLLSFICQLMIRRFVQRIRRKCSAKCDKRLRIISELITCIQHIKVCGLENIFKKLVADARSEELHYIIIRSSLNSIMVSITLFLVKVGQALIISLYQLNGEDVSPTKVFVVSSLMIYFGTSMGSNFPWSLTGCFESLASFQRLQKFLKLKEKTTYNFRPSIREGNRAADNDISLQLNSISSVLDSGTQPILTDVSFELKKGELVSIVGPVGSGKTSLLKTILGELKIVSGKLNIHAANLAYVSQEPWIFPGTILQNIVFGHAYNEVWFRQVVEACALGPDFNVMANGENEVVGDRGINLSGGQKSRVNLARAVYANADVYLLDDPFSAVDIKVARTIMEKCIHGLLSSKSIVLVTHQMQYLRSANQIIALKDGKMQLNETELKNIETNATYSQQEPKIDEIGMFEYVKKSDLILNTQKTNSEAITKVSLASKCELQYARGIKLRLHWEYWTAGSVCGFFILVMFGLFAQLFSSGADYWLKIWLGNLKNSTKSTVNGMYIYIGLVLAFGVTSIARNAYFAIVGNKSSEALHASMVNSLLRSKLNFYTNNNPGSIVNRISNDIGVIDDYVRPQYLTAINQSIQGIGALVVITIVSPILALPAVIMLVMFWMVRNFYANAGFNLKRTESKNRSPILGILNSALNGLTTIRGNKSEGAIRKQFCHLQDIHTTSYLGHAAATVSYVFLLDSATSVYAIFVIIFAVFVENYDVVTAGLILTSVISIITEFAVASARSVDLDTGLISIERIFEYINIEPEGVQLEPAAHPSEDWPSVGRIQVNGVSLRYGKNEPVLRDINLDINSDETIGLIGRTGAGKSSLVSALFRLEEVSAGSIYVDGLDISKISLNDLRPRLVMVQQNPLLFRGTLRRNLDPFGIVDDEKLWSTLKELKLESRFQMPNGLDSKITDSGKNLSLGERQLVALCRAIVRDSKILILDEATASVDNATDAMIQDVIQTKFPGRTKIIIAHRLSSVMDADKIAVLEAGNLLEYDHPFILLQNQSSYIYHLSKAAGEHIDREFREKALDSYRKFNLKND